MDEEQDEQSVDPRRRLLESLTPRQRYLLYALLAFGILLVFFMELSTR